MPEQAPLAVGVGVGDVVVDVVGVGDVVVDVVGVGDVVVDVVGVVVGALVAGAVVVGGIGDAVVGVVPPLLATVKCPRRLEVWPSDHLSTAWMVCDPSASFVVSYGSAVPSAAVPAKSKGGSGSARTGGVVRHRLSR
jgi:hypothetical protein